MSTVRTAAKRLKRGVVQLVGGPICSFPLFQRYRRRLLGAWPNPDRLGTLERAIHRATLAYWIEGVYLAEKNPDRREALKSELMGGDSGVQWAKHYDQTPIDLDAPMGAMTYREACPLLPELDRELDAARTPATVVQIGSSSGREIRWLAEKHPRHRFIGTDVYAEVVEYAARRYRRANLSFELCAASRVGNLLARQPDGAVFILSSGSLQYVQPEHLEVFFASLAALRGGRISLLEPASDAQGPPDRWPGSRWRGNLSYSHNYCHYAERAGLETMSYRIIKPFPANHPIHGSTVHFYYTARSRS